LLTGRALDDDRLQAQQRRDDWTRGLGGPKRVVELTWDEYNALSPERQAAIDINTAFVNAARNDAAAREATPQRTGDAAYTETVKRLFGEDGGSDLYAPETVALLNKLELSDTQTGDLDNYLNFSSLIGRQQFDAFGADPQAVSRALGLNLQDTAEGVAQNTSTPAEQAAARLYQRAPRVMAEVLQRGQTLLEAATGTRSSGVNPTAQTELDEMFDYLAQRGTYHVVTDEELANSAQYFQTTYGLSPEQLAEYFDHRLRGTVYGQVASLGNTPVPLGKMDGVDYITPDEFRTRYLRGAQ
jgi:hypothetical protein